MSQQLPAAPVRRYGSVEDSAEPCSLLSQQPESFEQSCESSRVQGVTGWGKAKRWISVSVIGSLAVGAMMAFINPARSPMANITKKKQDNFVEVDKKVGEKLGLRDEARLPTMAHTEIESPLLAPLAFTALNFYHVRDGKPAQDYPWLKNVKLIEPHRETTLAVISPREGFEYRWEVRGADVNAIGVEASAILTRLDENVITLKEIDRSDGTVARQLEETVMVKYVRREIRTLTDPEREELFDAMFQLWAVTVDGGNGKELYGDDYADIWAINRLHYKAASPLECDHFHDGLGFLTNHAILSNTFEYSLQRVNPKLTLPYWDFTIEASSSVHDQTGDIGEMDESAPVSIKSPIFDPSWFGTYDKTDNMLKDGRWAYTEIPLMRENNPGGISPDIYGKLRAPWNVNDRAYLSRGMGEMCGADVLKTYEWPSCSSHYDLMMDNSDFYSWVWESAYGPHGPIHIWIGGVIDCRDTYQAIGDLLGDQSIAAKLAEFAFLHRKNLYRSGFFRCEGTVDVSQSPEELYSTGTCGCIDYDLSQGDDYQTIYNSIVFLSDYVSGMNLDDDTKREITKAFCGMKVNDGDHLQASSSLDPSFWPTHPTMERLWMYGALTGQVTDFTWPDSDVTYTDDDGATVVESVSLYGETCSGHRGSDVFPFGLLDSDTDGFTIKTGVRENSDTGNKLTNREALQAFDPRVNALPYVYDTFKWDHCVSEGVDFGDAWKESADGTAPRVKRPSFVEGMPRLPLYPNVNKMMNNIVAAQGNKANK